MYIAVLLVSISTESCKERDLIDPEQVLPDSLMVLILTDGFILNSAFNQTFGEVKDSVSKVYSRQILEKYEVSEEQLETNLDFLNRNPMKMDSLFQQMLDRIDDLEEKMHVGDGDK